MAYGMFREIREDGRGVSLFTDTCLTGFIVCVTTDLRRYRVRLLNYRLSMTTVCLIGDSLATRILIACHIIRKEPKSKTSSTTDRILESLIASLLANLYNRSRLAPGDCIWRDRHYSPKNLKVHNGVIRFVVK